TECHSGETSSVDIDAIDHSLVCDAVAGSGKDDRIAEGHSAMVHPSPRWTGHLRRVRAIGIYDVDTGGDANDATEQHAASIGCPRRRLAVLVRIGDPYFVRAVFVDHEDNVRRPRDQERPARGISRYRRHRAGARARALPSPSGFGESP